MISKFLMIDQNGATNPFLCDAKTLDEINLQLPSGVYTTFRTYEKIKTLQPELHFDRLEKSAAILGTNLQINRNHVRQVIRDTLQNLNAGDYRIRLSVDLETGAHTIFLAFEPLLLPSKELFRIGAVVILAQDVRRDTPQAKSTVFIRKADEIRHHLPKGVNEALLTDASGLILEGLSSNFFSIRQGVLSTASEGVLEGITREIVLRCAQQMGIEVDFSGIHINELISCDECFITSTSRGVLPVIKVDNLVIGTGVPGPLTRALHKRFSLTIKRLVELI
jgi:branched-chain amino acid aminotransferase